MAQNETEVLQPFIIKNYIRNADWLIKPGSGF